MSLKMAKIFYNNSQLWNSSLKRMFYLASLGTVTHDPADTAYNKAFRNFK